MSKVLWRISQYPGLDGEGGLHCNGRWHTRGRRVLYTAEHPALALIEVMAHLDLSIDAIPDALKLCQIEVDTSSITRPTLPVGWHSNEIMSQKVGNIWLKNLESVLLEVPSAILPHATNYLINPSHPDALGQIRETSIEPIWIDKRFIR